MHRDHMTYNRGCLWLWIPLPLFTCFKMAASMPACRQFSQRYSYLLACTLTPNQSPLPISFVVYTLTVCRTRTSLLCYENSQSCKPVETGRCSPYPLLLVSFRIGWTITFHKQYWYNWYNICSRVDILSNAHFYVKSNSQKNNLIYVLILRVIPSFWKKVRCILIGCFMMSSTKYQNGSIDSLVCDW